MRTAGRRAARTLYMALPWAAIGALAFGPGATSALASQAPSAVTRGGSEPVATAARELNLQETGYLHSVGEPSVTVDEQGHATGTFDCTITVRLTIVSASRVTATFTVKPKGGSVTGTGSARFSRQGSNGYFGGTIAITHGTGSYAHASGANIGISGVIGLETYNLTVHVHGKIRI